jgi:hypothetical protein
MGFDTKTYWLTDRQSQCYFDFELLVPRVEPGSNTFTAPLRVVDKEKGKVISVTGREGP